MGYLTAKANFEKRILHMQEELRKYSARSSAQEQVIAYRVDQVNALVDYYSEAEDLISSLELMRTELEYHFIKLQGDAQKLVTYCELHQIDPNAIFHYSQQELDTLYREGYTMLPPRTNYVERPISESGTSKYHQLQLLRRAQPAA